jgi:phosphoribosylformylglycinamidine synthase
LGARLEVSTPLELFSETQGRALVACPPAHSIEILRAAERHGVPATEIGEVGGENLAFEVGGETFRAPVARLEAVWERALPKALGL